MSNLEIKTESLTEASVKTLRSASKKCEKLDLLCTEDPYCFVRAFQQNGNVQPDPKYKTVGELVKAAGRSVISQFEINPLKVIGIVKSLLKEGTLVLDPEVAYVEGKDGTLELSSGRHRIAAVLFLFALAGLSEDEYFDILVRVSEKKMEDTQKLARLVLANNESRNMPPSEKTSTLLSSVGTDPTNVGDIIRWADKTKQKPACSLAVGASLVALQQEGKVERFLVEPTEKEKGVQLTPENLLRLGKGVYNEVYGMTTDKGYLRTNGALWGMVEFLEENITDHALMALKRTEEKHGHKNMSREGFTYLKKSLALACCEAMDLVR